MHRGSCLCGDVRYEFDGEPGLSVYCHCRRCRKAGGSAFASNGTVRTEDFRFVAGTESLREFSTPEGVHRMFCGRCGSPIASRRDAYPEFVRVRLGTLDTPLAQGPSQHIFVGSKAEWFEILDALPQHAERPPP